MPQSLNKSVLAILTGIFLRAQSTYRTQFKEFLISVLLLSPPRLRSVQCLYKKQSPYGPRVAQRVPGS